MSKRPKHCNVNVSFYDGDLDFCFDCRHNCVHAMSEIMTSDGIGEDVECHCYHCGSCNHPRAQLDVLKELSKKIKEKIKELESDDDE